MNWISKLLCHLGMHGPRWCGLESQRRSTYSTPIRPFQRVCSVCGTRWHGEEIDTHRGYHPKRERVRWTLVP